MTEGVKMTSLFSQYFTLVPAMRVIYRWKGFFLLKNSYSWKAKLYFWSTRKHRTYLLWHLEWLIRVPKEKENGCVVYLQSGIFYHTSLQLLIRITPDTHHTIFVLWKVSHKRFLNSLLRGNASRGIVKWGIWTEFGQT